MRVNRGGKLAPVTSNLVYIVHDTSASRKASTISTMYVCINECATLLALYKSCGRFPATRLHYKHSRRLGAWRFVVESVRSRNVWSRNACSTVLEIAYYITLILMPLQFIESCPFLRFGQRKSQWHGSKRTLHGSDIKKKLTWCARTLLQIFQKGSKCLLAPTKKRLMITSKNNNLWKYFLGTSSILALFWLWSPGTVVCLLFVC